MAIHQSPGQRRTVERVMHKFKHGELKTAHGARKVKTPKQAIAIALHEAGASNRKAVTPTPAICASPSQRNAAAKPTRTRPRATVRPREFMPAQRDARMPAVRKMSKIELERALHYR